MIVIAVFFLLDVAGSEAGGRLKPFFALGLGGSFFEMARREVS